MYMRVLLCKSGHVCVCFNNKRLALVVGNGNFQKFDFLSNLLQNINLDYADGDDFPLDCVYIM